MYSLPQMTASDRWWDELKVGDEVFEQGRNSLSTSKVTKITPTQIKLGAVAINKDRGDKRTSDTWDQTRFYPKTTENVKAFNLWVARNRLGMQDWSKVPDELVWKVYQEVKLHRS